MSNVMDDNEMIRRVTAECRAEDLLRVLRHAVNGAAHWRFEAGRLLGEIDNGVLPVPREPIKRAVRCQPVGA